MLFQRQGNVRNSVGMASCYLLFMSVMMGTLAMEMDAAVGVR